ncbi:response regulator [Ktedonobacter robiniae]|uniref:Response regulatory domain-containing protein n=1 Tax=Ktedonobacter robiniae TaxID=2778365 RepID=A0ABQ3V0S3_9CHLR|nr:response regulator [Ktedonobacter robiniae]GHO58558.1 hypothetical protein KSB_70330 [Ktedonobacter robiniae]
MFNYAEQPGKTAKNILVVEDDAEIGLFLTEAIKQETPHTATLATTGKDALNHIKRMQLDLFVCDYRLPDMDGYTLYQVIRSMESYDDTPVILISAMPDLMAISVQHKKLLRMKKPIELDEFLYLLQELL